MPPKGKRLTTQQLATDVDVRLSKIESVLEKIADRFPEDTTQDDSPSTENRPARPSTSSSPTQRRARSLDSSDQPRNTGTFHSTNPDIASGTQGKSTAAAMNAPHAMPRDSGCLLVRPDPVTPAQRGDPLSEVNNIPAHTPDHGQAATLRQQPSRPTVNITTPSVPGSSDNMNSNPWGTWVDNSRPQTTFALPCHDTFDTDDVQHQVQNILASTAHSLSRGNVKPGTYPFKYITRGPDKHRVPINSVTLSEHLWGIIRMLKDDKVDQMIKPALVSHLEDIIEDSCEFEWAGIRKWSDDVFGMIAEGRFPKGWDSVDRIQMLRMSVSRIANLSAHHKEPYNRRQNASSTHPNYDNNRTHEITRGGPPCMAFNSQAGCQLYPGHLVNGKRMLHICSFCLCNTSAAYNHSEVHCRNKQRFGAQNF